MHKSSSKSEKPSSYENGSKFTEQNVEKLSRKMEQFEKIPFLAKLVLILVGAACTVGAIAGGFVVTYHLVTAIGAS